MRTPSRYVVALACFALAASGPVARAQTDAEPAAGTQEITVIGKRESYLATASSSSAGTITSTQIEEQPILRPAELLQLVPGLAVVAHAAGGKANQYYLRGFQMDHGDMFLTWVDGVPVNEVTHAHGPGYTDLNWLIPELVAGVDYEKGPYYADRGDFANAGAANIRTMRSITEPFLKEEAGGNGFARMLGADSIEIGPGTLLAAAEYTHDDGPWTVGNDYRKRVGLLRYSVGSGTDGYGVTLQGYRGNWLGADQVPLRAIDDGTIPRYGVINPGTGGTSSRYSLIGEWHEADDAGTTQATLYAVHYTLDLFADFTYFLGDPVNGDELRENDRRWTTGGHIERHLFGDYLGEGTEDRFGFEIRNDAIHSFLNAVESNRFLYNVRADGIGETMMSPWYQNDIAWTDWFSTVVGLRADILRYDDSSNDAANSGNGIAWRPSPKVGLKFGPWAETDFYVQAGLGISSEDIRGVTETVVPGPGGGQTAVQTAPLTRNRGAEAGIHTKAVPDLDMTFSLWVLESQNEFVFDGDSGAVDASGRPGRRWGFEWNNRWQPTEWLDLTADVAVSRAHYLDQNNPLGNQIPESVRWMSSGQASLHDLGWLPNTVWTLGWRYLGPRFLIEDGSIQSKPSLVFNAKAQYDFTPSLSVGVEVLNLTDAHYFDAQYYYVSRLPGEPLAGVADYMVHPAEPREFRMSLTERF